MESGLDWTILQLTHFLDKGRLGAVLKQGPPVFFAAWDTQVRFSFIDHQDYAEASAKVLLEGEKHYFAQYPLVSTMPMPYARVIEILGQELGKDVAIGRPPFDKAVDGLVQSVFGTLEIPLARRDEADRLILYYNWRGLAGNPQFLE